MAHADRGICPNRAIKQFLDRVHFRHTLLATPVKGSSLLSVAPAQGCYNPGIIATDAFRWGHCPGDNMSNPIFHGPQLGNHK